MVQKAQLNSSKTMAILSMVLAIVGFLTGLIFFVSIPLAIAALVLGIVALAKHKQGKGMSITGVVVAGVILLLAPFTLGAVIVAYGGITNRANESAILGNASSVQSVAEAFNADHGFYPALAATGANALALGSSTTMIPANVTVLPDKSAEVITSNSGTATIAYSCFPVCGGTTTTGGRITYWDPVSGSVEAIYLGVATSTSTFAYPAT
jgi:hypothetical protein